MIKDWEEHITKGSDANKLYFIGLANNVLQTVDILFYHVYYCKILKKAFDLHSKTQT